MHLTAVHVWIAGESVHVRSRSQGYEADFPRHTPWSVWTSHTQAVVLFQLHTPPRACWERRWTMWSWFFLTHTHTHWRTLSALRVHRSAPASITCKKPWPQTRASHRPLTLAQVARPATSLKRPKPLTSSDGAAAALNLNGGARRKPPLSQLGPAALARHYEIRQLRLQSMQIAVLFVWSCAASHSPLLHHHKQMRKCDKCVHVRCESHVHRVAPVLTRFLQNERPLSCAMPRTP